jgi:WD40 repeat protein
MEWNRKLLAGFVFIFLLCLTNYVQAQQSVRRATLVDWSLNGDHIAVAFSDGTVDIQDAVTGQIIYTSPPTRGSTILELEWSPHNNDILAFVTSSGVIYSIDLELADPLDVFRVGTAANGLAWHPSLNEIAIGVQGEEPAGVTYFAVEIYNMDTKARTNQFGLYEAAAGRVAWRPDGTQVASSGLNHDQAGNPIWEVTIWEVTNPSNMITIPTSGSAYLVWTSNDILVIGSGREGELQFLSANNGSVIDQLNFQGSIQDLVYNQTSNTIAFQIQPLDDRNLDKGIYLVDATSHNIIYQFSNYPLTVDIDLSPDGSELAYIDVTETSSVPIILSVIDLPVYTPQPTLTPSPTFTPTPAPGN